jgi:hypothetical protein
MLGGGVWILFLVFHFQHERAGFDVEAFDSAQSLREDFDSRMVTETL